VWTASDGKPKGLGVLDRRRQKTLIMVIPQRKGREYEGDD